MSSDRPSRPLPRSFRLILKSFLQRPGLPFSNVLSEEKIQAAFEVENASFAEDPDAVYTPAVTLWAFLSQVLYKGEQRSCIPAVGRVVVLLVALGREPCSNNTGAYCRARAKLSERVLQRLTCDLARGCEKALYDRWLWRGRHVYLVDGTTVSMPDTPENQAAYPQQPQQKKGLGFPIARVVTLLSLASGMLTDMALGPYAGKEAGETALLRPMLGGLNPGDILLADRYYGSYFMIAALMASGVDFVTRVHQLRTVDFGRGRRLGRGDHVVVWRRPARPTWMDAKTYECMPESIAVREVQVNVAEPGFRTRSYVVITTLTEAKRYSKDDIAELYYARWLAELDIRAIKETLGMDVLRCKTPEMVRKEMWACLLAYNLIRQTLLQTAQASGRRPRQLSLTAGMQLIAASWQVSVVGHGRLFRRLIGITLRNLSAFIIGDRPGRVEPRAVKRRPKPHDLLTKPRHQARAELLAPHAP